MTKICIEDTFLKIDPESIYIHREGGFLLISDSDTGNVFSQVKSIMNYKITPENIYVQKNEKEKYIQSLIKKKNLPEPAAVVLSHLNTGKIEIITEKNVTAIVSTDYPRKSIDVGISPVDEKYFLSDVFINTLVIINENLDFNTILKLFKTAVEAITSSLWDLDVNNSLNRNILYNDEDESLLMACTGFRPSKLTMEEMVELKRSVHKCVDAAVSNSMRNNGFPKTIIDYIRDNGVEVDDLVQAGFELLVGIEETPELRLELRNQILKSLKDVNVIALVMAGIRLEGDFNRQRIAGVDVYNDPAYLYADEVLGMAIANHIAGTKAIFNFKRYDEEKPGIIRGLGPILDDIFAGIVAGCMSKILEE